MKTKFTFTTIIAVLLASSQLIAQGKFAGSYRSLVGKTYLDKSQLPLAGFTPQGGILLGNFSMTWYSKGNLAVALFEIISKGGYTVRDVLQLSNFSSSQSLRLGNCVNARMIEDDSYVALVQLGTGDLLRAVAAWRWNDETKALEAVDKNEAAQISCPQGPQTLSNLATSAWKPYVNKIFKDTKDIPALKDYTLREGTVLPNKITAVSVYAKGTNFVLVFELILEDNYRFVVDIVETTVTDKQDVRVAMCNNGQVDDPFILAVVQQSKEKRWNATQAWICNSEQTAIISLSPKGITCLGNYGEN
jgi:hypothetical protein